MSFPNLQQKKTRAQSLIPSEEEQQRILGTGDDTAYFYQAVHPETEKVFKRAKLKYKNTPEQDSEEMYMDKIMTPDGDFIVERQVVVMTRLKALNLQEWLLIQEDLFGRTALGNPQKYARMRDISEHDEPEIEQRMVPGSGEQIRKKGESVLYHRTKYDIPFNKESVAEAMKRVKEPLKLQLYCKEEGQRGYRIKVPKIWETYSWEDLMFYCKTNKTKESREQEIVDAVKTMSDPKKQEIAAMLLQSMGSKLPDAVAANTNASNEADVSSGSGKRKQ